MIGDSPEIRGIFFRTLVGKAFWLRSRCRKSPEHGSDLVTVRYVRIFTVARQYGSQNMRFFNIEPILVATFLRGHEFDLNSFKSVYAGSH